MDVRRFSKSLVLIVFGSATIIGCGRTKKVEDLYISPSSTCRPMAVENRFIVSWKDGSYSRHTEKNADSFLGKIPEENLKDIKFIEHDYKVTTKESTNAPGMTALELQGYATEDDDSMGTTINWGPHRIDANLAWASGAKGNGVIVAVIDSPTDVTHKQLKPRLAINAAETADGIDNDKNGLVDDIYGYDFQAREPLTELRSSNPHGTMVSGIIVADHDSGRIQGVAPAAQLLPLAFMDDKGRGLISDALPAFQYAVKRGAKVINLSWGGPHCSQALQQMISSLETQDVLVVMAAGNEGQNLEIAPEFPAAYQFPHTLTVGASGYRDYTFEYSNFSSQLVHLLAPGVNVWSTTPQQGEYFTTGTSFSAPYVSGAAAVLKGYRPQATMIQVRQAILEGVDTEKGPYPVVSRGRLNVKKSMDALDRILTLRNL